MQLSLALTALILFAGLAISQKIAAEEPSQPAIVTPAEWLKQQPKPFFRKDHTLPRLTRYGWVLPPDARIELAEGWGYALEFGGYVGPNISAELDDPKSTSAQMAALAKADPKRYPLAVICTRTMPGTEAPPEAWTRDKDGKALNSKAKPMDITECSEENGAVFSLEAPDAAWEMAGEYRAAPLRELEKRGIPISIILNGGEYGLGVLGFSQPVWSLDPKIVAAVKSADQTAWREYASSKKANSEHLIANALRRALPKRDLYVFYTAGGGTLRNKDWSIDDWGLQWKHMRGVSDLPSNEVYYKHYNTGFTGRENLLTLALNAAAAEIASGDPLSYNWVCAGWTRDDAAQFLADLPRWAGFLKCYYTAGMLGCNVGYYEFPKGGFEAPFAADSPPMWLQQMIVSSHVHALFSQLEPLIRNSDLLAGPLKNGISTADPAYELASGDETVRVLARKHKTQAEWLITAWAAAGADRTVNIEVPELGWLTLDARACGSVYRASLNDGKVTLDFIDEEGATYTHATAKMPVTMAADHSIKPPIQDGLLLWLAADKGISKDEAGRVSSWQSQTSNALTLVQQDVSCRPLFSPQGLAGRPALSFEYAKFWLSTTAHGQTEPALNGPLTAFAIFNAPAPRGDQRVLSAITPNANDYSGAGFKITDSNITPTEIAQQVVIRCVQADLQTPLESLTLGSMSPAGSGSGFSGNLAEVLIYQGHLSETKSSLIEHYLVEKYSTPFP
jgi:hypothetical protein